MDSSPSCGYYNDYQHHAMRENRELIALNHFPCVYSRRPLALGQVYLGMRIGLVSE